MPDVCVCRFRIACIYTPINLGQLRPTKEKYIGFYLFIWVLISLSTLYRSYH